MTPLADLRAEAEALSRALPGLNLKAEASEAAHIGSAGRRRAGTGEHFWQYRRHASEDAAERIDWRRSARGDQLFVRESELETARTVLFWCDDHPGFDWKSETDTRTKADEARILMLALGLMLSRDGERIGALGAGRTPSFGKRAIDRLGEDLMRGTNGRLPGAPRGGAAIVIASDFYDGVQAWKQRLKPLAGPCPEGVLLAISAPIERDFPFEGRVKLSRPGSALDKIIGRAETVRDDYQARFARHHKDMQALATRMGWRYVAHDTGTPSLQGAAALKHALESFGARL